MVVAAVFSASTKQEATNQMKADGNANTAVYVKQKMVRKTSMLVPVKVKDVFRFSNLASLRASHVGALTSKTNELEVSECLE